MSTGFYRDSCCSVVCCLCSVLQTVCPLIVLLLFFELKIVVFVLRGLYIPFLMFPIFFTSILGMFPATQHTWFVFYFDHIVVCFYWTKDVRLPTLYLMFLFAIVRNSTPLFLRQLKELITKTSQQSRQLVVGYNGILHFSVLQNRRVHKYSS